MVDVLAPARAGSSSSYVEWGAVFAGALAASAISFVLLTAGASLGLSLLSPYASQSYGKSAASLAVFWSIAVPILSFLVGGYIAGRMRSAWDDTTLDEGNFRDGIHGLLVWALSIVAGGMLAFLAAGNDAQRPNEQAVDAVAEIAFVEGGVVPGRAHAPGYVAADEEREDRHRDRPEHGQGRRRLAVRLRCVG